MSEREERGRVGERRRGKVRDVGLTRRRNRTTLSLSRNRRRSARESAESLRDGKVGGHAGERKGWRRAKGGALPPYKLPKL